MIRHSQRSMGALMIVSAVLAGCDKLGLGSLGLGSQPQPSSQRPSPQELKRIGYMSQTAGAEGHKVFDHLAQAKSCRDLQLAMRWNRPPDILSGPFNKKMIYLSTRIPADLPKDSEVFLTGTIKRGQSLPSGAWGWSIALGDGTEVQAIEPAEYWQKQEQEQDPQQQKESGAAIVKPNEPGRKLCGNGIYQGMTGKSLQGGQSAPLVEVLFAIDRRR